MNFVPVLFHYSFLCQFNFLIVDLAVQKTSGPCLVFSAESESSLIHSKIAKMGYESQISFTLDTICPWYGYLYWCSSSDDSLSIHATLPSSSLRLDQSRA